MEQIDGFARAIRRACEAASRGKLVAVAPKYRHAGTADRVKNTDGIHLIMGRLYGVAGGGLHPSGVHHANRIEKLFRRKTAGILSSLGDQAGAALIAGVNP